MTAASVNVSSRGVSRHVPAARRTRSAIIGILRYSSLGLMTLITVFPFLWMLSTSFKVPGDAVVVPPEWLPDPFIVDNYVGLTQLKFIPFGTFVVNSTYIAALVVVGRLFICSLAGYAFARFDFPEKDLVFGILLASMMIPGMVAMIPLYIGYKNIGWLDTHLPLIIPPIIANTFGTFLLRQFFMTIPVELEEAARIDGSSSFGIYWRIMLPLSKPALATLAIFTLMNTWNDFFHPFIYLSKTDKFTLPVGLASFQSEFGTEYTLLMAGAVVAVIPILVVYVSAQRYFVEGIALTGIKG